MLDNPGLAIEQSKKELERMGDSCEKMLDLLSQLRQKNTPDSRLSSKLREYEISLDTIQEEITTFMTKL